MRIGVVGHHEWVTFIAVPHLPAQGEIVHGLDWWESPGGGGANAAVQLARLAGDAVFFTSFGDDEIGHEAYERLRLYGVEVHATFTQTPTRRAVTHIDPSGERTITVLGDRLEPSEEHDLPWELMAEMDAVYFTAGDAAALRHARRAGTVVATSRVFGFLVEAGERIDVVVGSSDDPSEVYEPGLLEPPPSVVVMTEGAAGGRYLMPDGGEGRYEPVEPEGPIVDRYGAGDCFAAGLTFGLARSLSLPDALALGARCGASVITGRGPFETQLEASGI